MNIQKSIAWSIVFSACSWGALSAFAADPVAPTNATEKAQVEGVSTNAMDASATNVVDEVAASNEVVRALANLRAEFVSKELELYKALVDSFEEKHPIYKKGDKLSITRPNGIVTGGQLKGVIQNEAILVQGTFEKKLQLKKLQIGDRLRLDRKFREAWLQMESRTSARKALEEEGKTFPSYDLAVKVQMENALEYADPKACYLMAESYRVGLRQEKDFGYVFIYNFMAAKQGHVDARYDLGRMYYGAISVLRNKRMGLQLISSAGADGHEKAEAFLAKHKVSAEAIKQAAAAYQERQQKEAELHAAQVERFNIANQAKKVDRSRRGVSIGK